MGVLTFINQVRDLIAFNNLSPEKRQLVFYSEGRSYWSYLGSLIDAVLDQSDLHVSYVTSSNDDPGLEFNHPRFRVFQIGEKSIRDWFFANVDASVFVMTMPDLQQYQVKRSKYDVHYVYVQHSLVSFHMVYRPGAFDYFDTIFCAGPHHLKEMRLIEKRDGLQAKNLFEHGYARVDAIIDQAQNSNNSVDTKSSEPRHYLFAPSWGEKGTIESGLGRKIVSNLLSKGHQVTLRPHPQTIKFHKPQVDEIVHEHQNNPLFTYEHSIDGQSSLHASDVMICDWSGAALDYSFGLGKPVIFIDVPKKVNDPSYIEIPLEPIEVSIREKIGIIISPDDIDALDTYEPSPVSSELINQHIFNVGNSDRVGADELIRMVKERTKEG